MTTRAAAYLFFPSITGLRFITALPEQHQTDRQKEAVDEAVDVIVQSMTHAIGNATTRDAHPKQHGLVRATFTVADNVPPEMRHGLFGVPRSYKAYIRFSNGRPTPALPPDAAPDVRGMAIKLFGVEGRKESADDDHDRAAGFPQVGTGRAG